METFRFREVSVLWNVRLKRFHCNIIGKIILPYLFNVFLPTVQNKTGLARLQDIPEQQGTEKHLIGQLRGIFFKVFHDSVRILPYIENVPYPKLSYISIALTENKKLIQNKERKAFRSVLVIERLNFSKHRTLQDIKTLQTPRLFYSPTDWSRTACYQC